MTTTTPATTKADPLPEVIPQPTYVKTELPSGLPLYIIRHESAFDEIEENDECPPVYFVLAATKRNNGESIPSKRVEWTAPAIYKRIARSSIGNGLIEQRTADQLGLAPLKNVAFWKLPAIPRSLVRRIDGFFRAVHAKFKSESIVMLTYDPLYAESENPSDGWGVLVPEQSNSGASCDYKPESVVEEKPEHVDIVGTAHSHPEMSAYASHTDVKDQVDFNGLHATAGWMTSKGGKTEWHIEYQLDNERFDFNPGDVFEMDVEDDFEDEDGWMDKVTKYVAPPAKNWGTPGGYGATSGGGGTKTSPTPSTPSPSKQYNAHFRAKHNSSRPHGCPDLVKNTVIIRLRDAKEEQCPVCKADFGKLSAIHRRCTTCFTYLLLPGEEPESILEARKEHYNNVPYVPGLEFLIGREGPAPVVIWERDPDEKKPTSQSVVWSPEQGKAVGASKK